jgi:hypothetical protein
MDACCNGKKNSRFSAVGQERSYSRLVINAGLFLCANNLSHLNHIIGSEIATAGVDF